MAKGFFSKAFKFVAVAGTFIAITSYIKQYKKFNRELDDDFHKFEDDDEVITNETDSFDYSDRKYTALSADKNDFILAAKDTANAAVSMAAAGKQLIKDVGSIIADNVSSAESLGSFSIKSAKKLAKDGLNKATDIINTSLNISTDKEISDEDLEVDVEVYEIDDTDTSDSIIYENEEKELEDIIDENIETSTTEKDNTAKAVQISEEE